MAQYFNFRDIKYTDLLTSNTTQTVSDVRLKATSLIGTTTSGIPFVPKTYKKFKFNSLRDDLDSFEANVGLFENNFNEFQGKILPYLAAYSTLERGNQLNFTRLLGGELNQSDYAGLLPGFNIIGNDNYSLYKIELNISDNTLINNLKNQYNYHLTGLDQLNYFGIILTKGCNITTAISVDVFNDIKYFKLKLNPASGNNTFINNIDTYYSKDTVSNVSVEKNQNIIFSLNRDDMFYWKHVLNSDIRRINDFGYCLLNYDDILNNFYINPRDIIDINNDVSIQITALGNNFKNFNQGYKSAISPWVVSQGFYNSFDLFDRTELKSRVKKLFRIHAINPGKIGNNLKIKIRPKTLKDSNTGYATFDLFVYDTSVSIKNHVLFFNDLNLNKNDVNFISRRIGDQKQYFDFNTYKVITEGEYVLQNHLIRVEVSDVIDNVEDSSKLIPAGFLNQTKINVANISKQIYNDFIIQPIFDNIFELKNQFKISDNHHWGKNFYDVKYTDPVDIPAFTSGYSFSNSLNVSNNSKEIQDIKLINYINNMNYLKNKNYLNSEYYTDISNEIDDNIFHLEKIILLNKFNTVTDSFQQDWQFSRYNTSILNINNIPPTFYNEIFNTFNGNNPYYFFTISEQSLILKNLLNIDSIEETQFFTNLINILDFSFDLNGGWDGLNILDINEYCINDKGLNQSAYLREIYKIAFDIINDESNGQNELMYLPEIYNQDVLKHVYSAIQKNRYSILLIDKPLYDNSNSPQIIYTTDFIKQTSGLTNQYKWGDFYYQYKDNNNLPNVSIDNSLVKYLNSPEISNISSFANYLVFELNPDFNSTQNINYPFKNTFVIPTGLIALYILNHYESNFINKMNPLYNNEISGLGQFQLINLADDVLNLTQIKNNTNLEININDTCVNFIYQDIIKGVSQYRFRSDKTNVFSKNNSSMLSSLNLRNTLSDIKRKIRLLSYLFLFDNIKNIKDLTQKISATYTLYLNQEKNNNTIEDFKLKIDETTTTREDILNNTIKGAIYLKFRGKKDFVKLEIVDLK